MSFSSHWRGDWRPPFHPLPGGSSGLTSPRFYPPLAGTGGLEGDSFFPSRQGRGSTGGWNLPTHQKIQLFFILPLRPQLLLLVRGHQERRNAPERCRADGADGVGCLTRTLPTCGIGCLRRHAQPYPRNHYPGKGRPPRLPFDNTRPLCPLWSPRVPPDIVGADLCVRSDPPACLPTL